jgi:hypothetical protein
MLNGRKAAVAVSLTVLFMLIAASAKASCPTIVPQACCGVTWYEFDVDSSCLSSYGAYSAYVSSCWPASISGYTYDMGFDNYTVWSFTVPANDTNYVRKAAWSARTIVTFNSPTSSAYDGIRGYVGVTHNNVETLYTWFYLYGNTSSSQSCAAQEVTFSATNGDTITLYIKNTRWDSSAVTEASTPVVFNTD